MMWSSEFDDSAWCLKEFNTLESKEAAGNGFRYVISKLDPTPLPGFAASKIYVDFSEQREGPRGSGLLQLLYGLSGEPLPPDAIALAEQIDEATQDDLLRSGPLGRPAIKRLCSACARRITLPGRVRPCCRAKPWRL